MIIGRKMKLRARGRKEAGIGERRDKTDRESEREKNY